MTRSLSSYWGCDEARLMDLYLRHLTPSRHRRAMTQLSREIAKYSRTNAFQMLPKDARTVSETKRQRTRIRKINKGFVPYLDDRKRTDNYSINAQQGAQQLAYLATYVANDGSEQRLAVQHASLPLQRYWAVQSSTGKQARTMQKVGLRLEPNSKKSKPVSQAWIRKNISQLHGLSLLLALSDRQHGELSEWTNLPKREVFQSDPQWVRAIATAILLS